MLGRLGCRHQAPPLPTTDAPPVPTPPPPPPPPCRTLAHPVAPPPSPLPPPPPTPTSAPPVEKAGGPIDAPSVKKLTHLFVLAHQTLMRKICYS